MKSTGIVRRIDDLGRIVIPMEIRKSLAIGDREPLEIYTDGEGHIILKKYNSLMGISSQINAIREMIDEYTNYKPEVTRKAVSLLTDLESLIKNADDEK